MGSQPLVTLDARMLGSSGIGTYLFGLLEMYARLEHGLRFRVLCREPGRVGLPSSDRFDLVRATAPIYSLREHWEIYHLAQGSQLLHCPHYNAPCFWRGRLVVTIHDLTHLTWRNLFSNPLAYPYARWMLASVTARATRIITGSAFSKLAIQTAFAVPDGRIRVVPYGLRSDLYPASPKDSPNRLPPGVTKPYVLFVGRLKAHKNVQGLIRAFALLSPVRRQSWQLVIAGPKDNYGGQLQRLTRELGLAHRVLFCGEVSAADLRSLYAEAELFVLPSFNEGFGLPALEAMAHGVPVIAANNSSLPEVVGPAGLLVDPHDVQALSAALEQLIADESLRHRLGELGRERAQAFSLEAFARRHLDVYREALKSS